MLHPLHRRFTLATLATLALLVHAGSLDPATLRAGAPPAANTSWPTAPLTRAACLDLGLQQNAAIRRARLDTEAALGIAIQTRAIALPKLQANGEYQLVDQGRVEQFSIPIFPGFPDQTWAAEIRLTQSIYEGGRLASAVRTARLIQDRALLGYQTVVADVLLDIGVGFDDVLLAEEQISVQEASVDLLSKELEDTRRRHAAGLAPQFNVLRAEVELANARPRLIRARNSFRLAKQRLANLLGFDLPAGAGDDVPLALHGALVPQTASVNLAEAIQAALSRRTELESLRKGRSIREEEVKQARAGYLPAARVFASYGARNSQFSPNIADELHGWTVGAGVSWSVFDGRLTQGKVKESRARLQSAEVELEDAGRRIELEVRTAYSYYIEAREVLESQEKVLEQAAEALRLARVRSDAGSGTQLDVLSAQTALTEARTIRNQALRDTSATWAQLQRATGASLPRAAQASDPVPARSSP